MHSQYSFFLSFLPRERAYLSLACLNYLSCCQNKTKQTSYKRRIFLLEFSCCVCFFFICFSLYFYHQFFYLASYINQALVDLLGRKQKGIVKCKFVWRLWCLCVLFCILLLLCYSTGKSSGDYSPTVRRTKGSKKERPFLLLLPSTVRLRSRFARILIFL